MSSNQDSVVIVAGARTPMGGFMGSLSSVSAPELGAIAIEEAVKRSGLQPADVQEVIMGNVLSAGLRQGPARQAMRKAGLPDNTGATTINKLCGSGMKATMMAHDAIKAGSVDIAVSGGMESMSKAPYILENARGGYRMGHGDQAKDHMFFDGLEDAETGKLMGAFAQDMSDKKEYTREQMDEYAIRSLNRAKDAIEKGLNTAEIVPVTVKSRRGETVVEQDEQPFNANIEKIPSLRPAFAKDGTITAANASSISDGASALVLARESVAAEKGLTPVARIVAHSTHSQHPSEFTAAPCGAIETLLAKTGWNKDDVDLWEINEAFAMVAMMPIDAFGLDAEKVNIYGGACAQGHPVGSTGSRLIVTLMNALKNTGGKKGIAALCIGGGEAVAVAIEMI
ncbi:MULTISPECIES: thiolase family protein [Thalassolituus]|jgi:acetyl-CoA C-acetyltransferase|uniref:Acetyl-CoA C-acetyltransferase n=2 Tax=Thalassolituus TaxID=187492 RepID=A0A1N7MDZ9_9GAMM|nr:MULTISPECIES: acetyl-CoA C-acyltransferase [Thalassolituus]KZZ00131.1 acetyl-CoA acetyltransferase [Oleibacter sp. HI0075]MAX85284.1 acetyl-CoA C-acyltransferase [Oceanospirillaceae bacterium]MEC8908401.1 acetyl-CoA C-acyltransferase [Pseudomonadota bacterium]HCG80162.1 acetyl-CoA C-acyltransferase [Oceanospirillales bacterium]MEC9409707.1 acetyl-CoA C-acyltransferase [Pseudomonadota bacterium]|tara:strand:- start:391 stop:1581 length:1191 start_codon:yes stop_codon:yes gene_type:complete